MREQHFLQHAKALDKLIQTSHADSNFLLFPLVASDAASGFIRVQFVLTTRLSTVTQKSPSPVVLEETDGCNR